MRIPLWSKLRISLSAFLISIAVAVGYAAIFHFEQSNDTIISGKTMGTFYRVQVLNHQESETEIRSVIDETLATIDLELNHWVEHSWVSKFNRTPSGSYVSVPEHAFTLLEMSIDLNLKTQGAFDVTVGQVVDLWGYGPSSNQVLPSTEALQGFLTSSGDTRIDLQSDVRLLRKNFPEVQLDFSAIAKGYTVDLIAERFAELGLEDYLIDIGGEMRAAGRPEVSRNWIVSISGVDHQLELIDSGLATSGGGLVSRQDGGEKTISIVDPGTARPKTNGAFSVTVVAQSCALADAAATAAYVLGPERSQSVLDISGVKQIIFVDEAGTIIGLGP